MPFNMMPCRTFCQGGNNIKEDRDENFKKPGIMQETRSWTRTEV